MEECPICGGEVVKEVVTEVFEYRGFTCPVNNYVVYVCKKCKESFVDGETLKSVEKVIREFHMEVNNKLAPVGHICFNTQDAKGWCIRNYPRFLCSLCSFRQSGIDLNKEQYEIMKS